MVPLVAATRSGMDESTRRALKIHNGPACGHPVCQHAEMTARGPGRICLAAVVMWALVCPLIDIPAASGDPYPDSEVVFARGTGEPPGVGTVGQAFIDSLRSQVPGRTVGVYPVNYPATDDYRNSALAGADDLSAHLQNMTANCPDTAMVLGGYSQGASVVDFASDSMPSETSNHVAAVALFGNPSSSYASSLMGSPLPAIDRVTAARRSPSAFPTT